ncbi:MAG: sulfatase/phosphatase domain-containing protein, partial [Planctomycetota bacterium]|nr:sulfatase/phosphatase domain-containing protein [Planctomycetota bacterium]
KKTVIIYTSDNGFFCGSHGFGSKVLPYEESSRVPLILLDPRHPNSGRKIRCGELTGNIDFAPTILALAGIEIPGSMDGKNLMKLYDRPREKIHESLPLINVWGPRPTFSLSIVTRDLKYIYWPYQDDKTRPAEELYELANDPLELSNVVKFSRFKEGLQKQYDRVVSQWKQAGVDYHGYEGLGEFFERN